MALACVSAIGGLSGTASAAPSAGASVNVADYGANGNGTADNTAAFDAAIAAAEADGGGTVEVPAGTYAFTHTMAGSVPVSLRLNGSAPVKLVGAGAGNTSLVEHVPNQLLVSINQNDSGVEDMTLNAKTYGGGAAVTVRGNHNILDDDSIIGADKTNKIGTGLQSAFAIYFAGPPGASAARPRYDVGNEVLNTNIVDGVNNDGFSFSFQRDATISNITHFGSRLALFIDDGVKVTNYRYTPNPACLGAVDGFWITSPSENITIDGFTSKGAGGVISGPVNTYVSKNITIKDETLLATGERLEIGDVEGLTLEDSSFGIGNFLFVNPNSADDALVVNNTKLPGVEFSGYQGKHYPSVNMTFNNDSFRRFVYQRSAMPTFEETTPVGPTTVTINGGLFWNSQGGFVKGATVPTFKITGLKQGVPKSG